MATYYLIHVILIIIIHRCNVCEEECRRKTNKLRSLFIRYPAIIAAMGKNAAAEMPWSSQVHLLVRWFAKVENGKGIISFTCCSPLCMLWHEILILFPPIILEEVSTNSSTLQGEWPKIGAGYKCLKQGPVTACTFYQRGAVSSLVFFAASSLQRGSALEQLRRNGHSWGGGVQGSYLAKEYSYINW